MGGKKEKPQKINGIPNKTGRKQQTRWLDSDDATSMPPSRVKSQEYLDFDFSSSPVIGLGNPSSG
jgi:hypothetical protein